MSATCTGSADSAPSRRHGSGNGTPADRNKTFTDGSIRFSEGGGCHTSCLRGGLPTQRRAAHRPRAAGRTAGRRNRRFPRTVAHGLHVRRPLSATHAARRRRGGPGAAAAGDAQAAADGHRGPARAPRRRGLQLRRGAGAGPHHGTGAEDAHPQLRRVLRSPLVRVGRRRGVGHGAALRLRDRLRPRPHLRRERRGVRHRALRGPVGRRAPLVAPGAGGRTRGVQPLGIARGGREARLRAQPGGAAVGPHDGGLRLLLGRRGRVVHRPGVRGQGLRGRERHDPARGGALLRRRTARDGRRGPRTPRRRTPPHHHLRPRGRRARHHGHRAGDPREPASGDARTSARRAAFRAGRRAPQRAVRGDPRHPVLRPGPPPRTHRMPQGGDRHFGRSGLDAGAARNRAHVRPPRPRPPGHRRHHHAGLRHQHAHARQRRGADARTGRHGTRNTHRQGVRTALRRHRA